ncbi:hypothetical protein J2T55_002137 [Methylohalomonas lacus]|uniref:Uncharacterized protein n=1 Tax=Methylohalomonas lacus TaxID=398773 RepID=A0AAE3L1I3_9GAMM|nr:hypothetical protein [Methylohalomonas lacus]MCS3904104.1 hypothetical protein [Methylohalomonas lacus]
MSVLLEIAGVALGVWVVIGIGLKAMHDGYTYDNNLPHGQRTIHRSERPVRFWYVSGFYTLGGIGIIFYSLGYLG